MSSQGTGLSNDVIEFAIQEMKALQKYIQERVDYLQKNSMAPEKAPLAKPTPDRLPELFWRPTAKGNGEFVNKSQVPEWVAGIADIKKGFKLGEYMYLLFDSGVLWRRKI